MGRLIFKTKRRCATEMFIPRIFRGIPQGENVTDENGRSRLKNVIVAFPYCGLNNIQGDPMKKVV